MAKYRVVYSVTKWLDQFIEAESFNEAEQKWEDEGLEGELSYIEDEEGYKVIFD